MRRTSLRCEGEGLVKGWCWEVASATGQVRQFVRESKTKKREGGRNWFLAGSSGPWGHWFLVRRVAQARGRRGGGLDFDVDELGLDDYGERTRKRRRTNLMRRKMMSLSLSWNLSLSLSWNLSWSLSWNWSLSSKKKKKTSWTTTS